MVTRVVGSVLLWSCACGFVDGDPIVMASAAGTLGSTTSSPTTGGTNPGQTEGSAVSSSSSEADTGADSTGIANPCACEGREPQERCLRFINECGQTIWAGASGQEQPAGRLDAVSVLEPQQCVAVAVQEVSAGRAWARTGCVDDVCASDGNEGRGTLVQFQISDRGADLYDVSLVEGFNLPMAMIPVGFGSGPGGPSSCESVSCAADLTVPAVCAEPLRRFDPNDASTIAYCASACRGCSACPDCNDCGASMGPICLPCGTLAELCCTGQACAQTTYSQLWKSLCPDALSYADDEGTATCSEPTDYDIVYCP